MSMSRQQAVDEIVETYVELAKTDKYKFAPANILSDRAEAALRGLGVTDEEIAGWVTRSQAMGMQDTRNRYDDYTFTRPR